jgi:Tfp pilus assembly protein PilF
MSTTKPKWFSSFVMLSAGLIVPLFFAGSALAQMGGIDPNPSSPGTGGRNVIEGRLYYPSGRNVDKRFKVHLESIRGGDFFTMADDTGAFSFRRVGAGSYVVTVEVGKDFEPITERVDVSDGTSARGSMIGRTYNLQIQLRPKQSGTVRPGTINAALANVPKSAIELYDKALESEQKNEDNKALDQLRQAVEMYPDFALAFNEMALIYQRTKQMDKAVDALAAAVRVAPEVFELRLNYGIVLSKLGKYSEAEPELKKAIQLKDTSTLAHLFHSKVLIQLKNLSQAETELQTIIKLGGNEVPIAYRYLGALYKEQGKKEEAIAALEKYLQLDPKVKDAESIRQIIKELR